MSKNMKNCILVDWKPRTYWDFQDELQKQSKASWEVKGVNASGQFHSTFQKVFKHYIPYFMFPFSIFLKRNQYATILGWQQFFGLILAFYCQVFRVKTFPKIVVLTFIYKEKKGFAGKLYFKFIKNILRSSYIHKVIVFSKHEKRYYTELFALPKGVIDCCVYAGFEGEIIENTFAEEKYFIAPGRSNRDYDFLVDELTNTEYPVRIICDNYKRKAASDHIGIYHHIFGNQYVEMLKGAYAVLVPLSDGNISSGQLVFLKAMQYGKPIIVTDNESVHEYVVDDYNGIVIEKNGEQLRKGMEKLLSDHAYYKRLSENAQEYYTKNFNTEAFVRNILQIV